MAKRFNPGDIFGVPLPNGSMAVGQVLARERQALNSVGCAFFSAVVTTPNPVLGALEPIAILLVTPDLLNKGVWNVLSNAPVVVPSQERPYEQFRQSNWIGVTITGSRNAQEFLAAYHGLCPWDDWHDPSYLDKLLLPSVERPKHVILCKGG